MNPRSRRRRRRGAEGNQDDRKVGFGIGRWVGLLYNGQRRATVKGGMEAPAATARQMWNPSNLDSQSFLARPLSVLNFAAGAAGRQDHLTGWRAASARPCLPHRPHCAGIEKVLSLSPIRRQLPVPALRVFNRACQLSASLAEVTPAPEQSRPRKPHHGRKVPLEDRLTGDIAGACCGFRRKSRMRGISKTVCAECEARPGECA